MEKASARGPFHGRATNSELYFGSTAGIVGLVEVIVGYQIARVMREVARFGVCLQVGDSIVLAAGHQYWLDPAPRIMT